MKLRGKLPGLSYTPKLRVVVCLKMCMKGMYIFKYTTAVEEHSVVGRSIIERICGRSRRENAGISSESIVRIYAVESLRFPGEGSSAQGKSGPKERPKSVADGQQVEIPALPKYLKDVRDTGEEDKRGRGKTRIERYSERYKVTNYQESH